MKAFSKILVILVLIVFALLLVVRFAASPWVTAVANRKLTALPQHTGKIGSVQIALWRGTISATGLQLFSRSKESDGPVVKLHHATLTIAWLPLFKGKLGGHGLIDGIEVMIVNESGVDDPDKQEPPFPVQHQRAPGLESKVNPAPLWHGKRYRAAGKLLDKVALITGGDSGIGPRGGVFLRPRRR